MKTQQTCFKALNNSELNKLVQITKESVSDFTAFQSKKSFGITNLWKVQKMRKNRTIRRELVF